MTARLIVLRLWSWRRLFRPQSLLMSVMVLALLLVSGMLAFRLLKPATPTQILPGQTLAWDIARAAGHSADVQVISGAYLPGDRLLLYTRTSQADRTRVRTWALTQIAPFADRLTKQPASEQLIWIIDFGPAPAEQEVLVAPLNRATDAALYQYVSAAPGLFGQRDAAAAPPPSAPIAAQPTATLAPPTPQPTAIPAAQQTTAPAVQAITQPTAAPVAVPSTALLVTAQPNTQPLLATAQPNTQPLVATGFDETSINSAWLPLSGDWLAHDGIYSQRDNSGYDRISMLDSEPQSHYVMQAKLRLGDGDMGGGFVYNAPKKDTRAGAQIVDFDAKGGFLRWGRYDDNGAYAYTAGVKIAPPISDGQWHDLQLTTNATASVVTLDGRRVGTIANTSPSGYMGLSASKTKVDFDNFTVTILSDTGIGGVPQLPATPQPTSAPAALTSFADDFADGDTKGWQVLSGTWQNINGTYQQTSISGSDLGAISPFQSDHFSATVRLQRLDGTMGAGLYFNMAQRDKKSNSQMINYTQNGKALQWGHFDEGGNFSFEGSAPVPDGGDGEWHVLQLRVNAGKATITLDGKPIAKDVALTYRSGYLGLLASNSKVAFDDVQFVAQE